jgi:hypothetical protein
MSKPFDATMKDLLEGHAADWAGLLGPWRFREAEWIDAEISTVSAAADKVLRVVADPADWIMHVEAQTGPDAGVPQRAHLYNTLLYNRHGLLVRSVVVLLRQQANLSALNGVYELQFPDEEEPYEVFRYRVVRVWELPLEALLTGGLGTLPLAPLTDEARAVLPAVVSRIDQRLRAEAPPEEADKLWAATFVLMGLLYPLDLTRQLFQGVTAMEESVTYQFIINKGAIRGVKKLLLAMGQKMLGPPDPATVTAIEAIDDLDRLQQLGERLPDVSSWQELLSLPSA